MDLASKYGDTELGHIWIDNDGNIYGDYYRFNNLALSRRRRTKGADGKVRKSGVDKSAFFINAETQNIELFDYDLDGKFDQANTIVFLPSGNIRVITTVMDDEDDFITALLFWEFSNNGELLTFNKNVLSDEDHKRLNNRPGPATRVSDIVSHTVMPDGSSLITLEQNFIFKMVSGKGGPFGNTFETTKIYGSADVHLIKFNSKGEIVKYADVRKLIESTTGITGALSHSTIAFDDDSLILFYNDKENNDISEKR